MQQSADFRVALLVPVLTIQCCCLQAPALHAQLQEQLQEQVSCPQCSQALMW